MEKITHTEAHKSTLKGKKVIKQDFTLINHLYTKIQSNHLASDPRLIRLFGKDFRANKHHSMRETNHFIQLIVF